jgi:hypothetical protein
MYARATKSRAGRWAYFLGYIWASTLLNPTSAVRIDRQDYSTEANGVGTSNLFNFHESARQTNQVKLHPIRVGGLVGINSSMFSENNMFEGGLAVGNIDISFGSANSRKSRSSDLVSQSYVVSIRHYKRSVVPARKDYLPFAVVLPSSISGSRDNSELYTCAHECESKLRVSYKEFSPQIAVSVHEAFVNYFGDVESNRKIFIETSKGIKGGGLLSDFADFNRLVADQRRALAVRRNDNEVWHPENDHTGRHKLETTKEKKSQKQPAYIRYNKSAIVQLPEDGLILPVGQGLDVSPDGKRWFHLFGPECTRQEEPWLVETKTAPSGERRWWQIWPKPNTPN